MNNNNIPVLDRGEPLPKFMRKYCEWWHAWDRITGMNSFL